jgi:hypothetical protein
VVGRKVATRVWCLLWIRLSVFGLDKKAVLDIRNTRMSHSAIGGCG